MERSNQNIAFLKNPAIRKWTLLALVFTASGLLNFLLIIIDALSYPGTITWKISLIWELAKSYGILLLLPVMLRVMARFPIERGKLAPRISLHILNSVLFGFVHACLLWGIHLLLSELCTETADKHTPSYT
jgi:hypothetical protein